MTLAPGHLTEFAIIGVVALITTAVALWATSLIGLIVDEKSFVPSPLDYLRTFVLAGCSSFIVNYLYKLVDKTFIFCKVWIEFLALLLLAYPQKTEQQFTYSSWNLVKREGYLFGVFYTIIYLVLYIADLWKLEMDESELNKYVRTEDAEANINQEVRKKSTLSNCLNIRKNSSNLKKVIYSTDYHSIGRLDEGDLHLAEAENLLKKPDVLIADANSLDFLSQSQSFSTRDRIAQEDMQNSVLYGSVITSVMSRGSVSSQGHGVDTRWIAENSLWIIVTMMHEIGISLLLSITFIYVPELDNSLFTEIEIFFYNKINLFCMEIVTPLFVFSSLIQILLHAHSDDSEQRLRTFIAYTGVSVVLFTLGILLT